MRPPRTDHDGALHHVMNRGARREPIFTSRADGDLFLAVVAEQLDRSGLEIHAYCLMSNHFHFLARSPTARLSDFMQHLSSVYTRAVNRRYGHDGPLFRGRFLSKPITSDAYLRTVSRYIHRNPTDIRPPVALDRYRWSSYRAYLEPSVAPDWLSTDLLWPLHGSDVGRFRRHVEGDPIPIRPDELRDLVAMALAATGADDDSQRLERLVTTALTTHLTSTAAAAVLEQLRYPTAGSIRSAMWRARRHLADHPEHAGVLATILATASVTPGV
ncbi:MAG: transposase [Ilumatobacteraceae bacterium]